MRFYFLLLTFLLSNFLVAGDDSFITNLEYAKMLYKNPRGIGCDRCHGLKGEGKTLVVYKVKGKIKKLKSPQINSLSKELFFKSFSKRHKIMPKYFLTYQEINALYFYLQSFKKNSKKRKKNGKKKIIRRVRKSKKGNPRRG